MQLLQIAFAAAVVLSFGLLGRMMAMHDSLPSGPHTDHVDSSLHKILRQQRRLEDHLEHLSQQVEQLRVASQVPEHQRSKRHSGHHDHDATHLGASGATGAATGAASASSAKVLGPTAECPNRKPFHTLLTAQASVYQQWQARIAYYHWKKQARIAGPCTDMVGFHRLCATEGGKPDGLEAEIPTMFTVQLSREVIESHLASACSTGPTRSASSSLRRRCARSSSRRTCCCSRPTTCS